MENKNISVQLTKKLSKASYSFVGGLVSRKVVSDVVIVEQPLQITLVWTQNSQAKSNVFAITMRTPGNEKALIIGLLISEGIIFCLSDIDSIHIDSDEKNNNQWLVQFIDGFVPKLASLARYQVTYSSCGLCGSTSLNALELKNPIKLTTPEQGFNFSAQKLSQLANKMAQQQSLFIETGGVHGAALFNKQGELLHSFEDIGRHNAVDKVIGSYLLAQNNPKKFKSELKPELKPELKEHIDELLVLQVSGRISFEIVQKALMAGFSILAGVGAPSDLAVQAAQRFDLTLIGFSSELGFNVYHGDWRLHR